MEKELFELIELLENDDPYGIGIHPNSYADEEMGYRVYHKDGYCFDVTKIKDYENDEVGHYTYKYHEGAFDGFKDLPLEKAIKLIKSETNDTGRN